MNNETKKELSNIKKACITGFIAGCGMATMLTHMIVIPFLESLNTDQPEFAINNLFLYFPPILIVYAFTSTVYKINKRALLENNKDIQESDI